MSIQEAAYKKKRIGRQPAPSRRAFLIYLRYNLMNYIDEKTIKVKNDAS